MDAIVREASHEIKENGKQTMSFDEFIDGETDLRQETTARRTINSAMCSTWIDALLALKRYKRATKLLGRGREAADSASDVLHGLCQSNEVSIRQLAELVAYGADVNYQPSNSDYAPIHFLSQHLAHEKLRYLCTVGANCNIVDRATQATPLIAACAVYPSATKKSRIAQLKTVKVLLAQKPDIIDNADGDGNTALDFAVAGSAVWVVKALVSAGASVLQSKVQTFLQTERRERTLLSQFFVDYESPDVWIAGQIIRHGASKVCRGLVQFKWRMELRTSASTRAVEAALEDRHDWATRDTAAVTLTPNPTAAVLQQTPAQRAAQLEQHKQRRKQIREMKRQVRLAKEQNAREVEQEQRKHEYLKRVEDQYKVSFQGLFPR